MIVFRGCVRHSVRKGFKRTALALVLLLTGACLALDVTVMTYNIRYGTADDGVNSWKQRRSLLIHQLGKADADTIGLQEALRFQISEIRKALPRYGEVGIGRDGGIEGEYACILYDSRRFEAIDSGTFWLSATPDKRSRDWGGACVRICTWGLFSHRATGAIFYHYNTHLDHRSARARLKGVQLIAQRIAAGKRGVPFVLTGDFNAGEESRPLRYLRGNAVADVSGRTPVPMIDTFRVRHPRATKVGTFNGFTGRTTGAKIDSILVAPQTRVLAAGIDFSMPGGRCVSDHFPVTAALRFSYRKRRKREETAISEPSGQ